MSAILGATASAAAESIGARWEEACAALAERSSAAEVLADDVRLRVCFRGDHAFIATTEVAVSTFVDGRFYGPVELTGADAAHRLACLFAAEGPALFERLDGDFAITVIDHRARHVYLVRDRWGMHPLYWSNVGGVCAWSSHCKSLLPLLSRREIDPAGVTEILMYRWLAGDRTMFSGVNRVLPGSWVRFDLDEQPTAPRQHVFWRYQLQPSPVEQPMSYWANEVDRAIDEAMARRATGAGSIATLLSGGVDSSLLAQYVIRQPARQLLISPTWAGYRDPELDRAIAYGKLINAEHRVIRYDPDCVDDAFALVIRRFEQPPRSHHSLTLAMLIPDMREFDLLVHGEGADALFGNEGLRLVRNYHRKRTRVERLGALSRLIGRLLPESPARIRALRTLMTASTADKVRAYGDLKHRASLTRHWQALGLTFGMNAALLSAVEPDPRDPMYHRQVIGLYTGVQDHVEMMDALFPGTGARTIMPFLSSEVTDIAQRAPTEYKLEASGRTKPIIKLLASRFYPSSMADAPKLGFPAPARSWLEGPLRGRVQRLVRAETPSSTLFGEAIVRGLQLPQDLEAIWTFISIDELVTSFKLDPVLRNVST